jgi:hypothetical protein
VSERIALFVIEKGQYWCWFLRLLYNFLTKSVRGFCGGEPRKSNSNFLLWISSRLIFDG